jgi:AcrR family transcriptional regulator
MDEGGAGSRYRAQMNGDGEGLVNPPEDRRVRRTKAALRQAIVRLVTQKGYEAVTIDSIVSEADTTRASFYSHFSNKEALLADVVDEFAYSVVNAFRPPHPDGSPSSRLAVLLEVTRTHADIARIIVSGQGDGVALRRFTEQTEAILAEDLERFQQDHVVSMQLPASLITALRAAQIVAAVRWFVEEPTADAEEIARLVNTTIERGWLWAACASGGLIGD